MKLSNLFKKVTKNNATTSVQKLEKNQLSKIVGGDGELEHAINQPGISVKSKPTSK
ncbi:MAG TPA: hypothetical protein PKZ75_05575 [Bacteroidia bacterium]|nr:hypothetical protein [Bacteroidia bacterium]